MGKNIKAYLLLSPKEIENHFKGEENHILNYDPYDYPENANLTEEELKFLEDYATRTGRLPVIGRLTSANSSGEYPWTFEGENAIGGYHCESLNIAHGTDNLQPCGRYLLGCDVKSVISCLVSSLYTDCRVDVVDVCALWGWIYVVDLQSGISYFGNQSTIFPPNHEDGEGKSIEQVLGEADQFMTEYPRYLEFITQQ
jgi:hypothetical protein